MSHELQSAPALLVGTASRVSAADKAALELQARPAVLRATVHVTRAATGLVETFELVGTAEPTTKEP